MVYHQWCFWEKMATLFTTYLIWSGSSKVTQNTYLGVYRYNHTFYQVFEGVLKLWKISSQFFFALRDMLFSKICKSLRCSCVISTPLSSQCSSQAVTSIPMPIQTLIDYVTVLLNHHTSSRSTRWNQSPQMWTWICITGQATIIA